MSKNIVAKYNIPAPRYTSYPTVPYWDDNLNETEWKNHLKTAFSAHGQKGISIYIHLPYCESLCTYCACNTRITVNHAVERPYIETLLKEWQLYLAQFDDKPVLKELHLGGGTPTFFSPDNLHYLIASILQTCTLSEQYDFSFEGHPANTTTEHLHTLYELGFKRVSFGVQDFDETVQDAINRYQTFEEVKQVIDSARSIGYTSVNVDLVYGLPYQTERSVKDTVQKIITLQPDRIAFYSYAHVPWIKPGQRKFSEADLPESAVKRALYDLGKTAFMGAGYEDVGMDHFALPHDELFEAFRNGNLHRNFMGYTAQQAKLLVGLGCSAIGDSWTAFCQNLKTVETYRDAVEKGHFPIQRGHILTSEDLRIRQHLLDLLCRHVTHFTEEEYPLFEKGCVRLTELVNDGLVDISGYTIKASDLGKAFLRNICLSIDERYWQKVPETVMFSTTA